MRQKDSKGVSLNNTYSDGQLHCPSVKRCEKVFQIKLNFISISKICEAWTRRHRISELSQRRVPQMERGTWFERNLCPCTLSNVLDASRYDLTALCASCCTSGIIGRTLKHVRSTKWFQLRRGKQNFGR